jgi:hypothetical protein
MLYDLSKLCETSEDITQAFYNFVTKYQCPRKNTFQKRVMHSCELYLFMIAHKQAYSKSIKFVALPPAPSSSSSSWSAILA